ncbi:MAG: T9SS type A sorting domain-containing protein, partial [Bacteroidales bacterium]
IDPCTFVDADDVVIFVQPDLANVDAGDDGATCEATPYQLTGTADNASIIFWSTTGDGAFDDAGILNPIYTPGADDIDNGSVELCINALPILPCYGTGPVVDCMTLSIQGAPTADAGFDQTICEDQTALLNGSATNYASLLWTGNVDDATILNPVYTPTAADILAGFAELCLTAEAVDPCSVDATDCVTIYIIGLPEVNAGVDATICETETFTTAPTVVNATQVFWSTNGDGYFDDEQSEVTVYNPGTGDLDAGTVELCLTAVGDVPCQSQVDDCLVLTFDVAPTAAAGDDATICEGDTYQLAGSATDYSALEWTTTGDGAFDDATVLDAVYTPGANDILAGSVELCLNATGAGACNLEVAEDCMTLVIVQNPKITLDPQRELGCDDFNTVTLKWEPVELDANVTVEFATSVLWSTAGDGHFDDVTVENAIYHLGLNDIWGGGVTLTLKAYGPGACSYVAEATIQLLVPTQIIQVESVNAWRGISSYVDKSAVTVPAVMAPVVNELIIMINKAGKYYWPEPTPPINQLGNWLPIGYKAKFESPCCLPIYGTPVTDQTFLVNGNFTYLPVLTNVSTSIADLIGADTTKIQLIFDWVSQDVWYRPAVFSGTFTTLEPGNAYLLVAKSPYTPFTVTYPAFDLNQPVVTKVNGAVDFGPNTTPWNDVVRTSQAHFIMFADVASSQLHAGDVLAAFDQNGNCVGMETYVGSESLYKLVANGDDLLTSEIDGYEEGEAMSFKLYRQSSEEIFDVAFTYDPNYPNYDGNFATYGVSNVVGMTMSITSINEVTDNNVQVYPNPAKDVINVVSDLNVKNITLVNYVGQMVYNQNVNGNSFQINVSGLGTGMYVVRIETIDGSIITKRITVK